MKWNNLPQEILIVIFTKVRYALYYDFNLIECALTCQSWKSAAQPLLFSEIGIKSIDHLEKIFAKELLFGKFVKGIDLDFEDDDSDSPEQILELIAAHFPFLEGFQLYSDSDSILSALCRLIIKGVFPHLKVVAPSAFEECKLIKLYTSCIVTLQNNINTVDITNYPRGKSMEYKDLLDITNQLPNLSSVHLSFNYSGVDNFADFIESTISDINLESLDVSFPGPIDYDNAPIPLQVSGQQIKLLQRLTQLTVFPQQQNINHTQPRIVIIGGDDSLLYIMKKSHNVNTFTLTCSLPGFAPESVPRPSIPVTVQFLLYLSRMESCTVYNLVTDSNTVDILSQYYDDLNNVKAPKLKNMLSINCLKRQPLNFQCSNAHLTVRTREFNDNPPNLRDIEVYLKKNNRGHYLSPFDLIKNIGKFTEELSLNGCVSYKEESLLNCIVKHCTRLGRLNTSNMDQGFFHDQEVDINKNYHLKELSVDGYLSFSNKTATHIQDYFPFIEQLYIKYDCKEEGEARHNFLEMKMPCPKLKHLKITLNKWKKDSDLIISIKLTNENNQTLYFTIELWSNDFSNTHSSHSLEKITPREYNKNIKNIDCANFLIRCESIEEIKIAY